MSPTGAGARDKGNAAELEVARIFTDAGFECRRTPNSGGLFIPGDIVWLGGQALNLHVEVKRQERLEIQRWTRQADAECPEGSVPVLCYRTNRQPWRSVLETVQLVQILHDRHALREMVRRLSPNGLHR